jgi:PAS domain S-box-containing protein
MEVNTSRNNKKNNSFSYLKYGGLIGLLFPVTAWIYYFFIQSHKINILEIKALHVNNHLIFIIYLIPVISILYSILTSKIYLKKNKQLIDEIKTQNNLIQQFSDFANLFREEKIKSIENYSIEQSAVSKELSTIKTFFIKQLKSETGLSLIALRKEKIAEILRKHSEIKPLVSDLLNNIIEQTNSIQGAFYIFDDDEQKFINIYTYAYGREKFKEQKFKPGEGLIGQAAYEKHYILRKNIPDNYITINSGLIGEKKPEALFILPLIGNENVQGIIEIASLSHTFNEETISFLTELTEIIGQTLFNFKAGSTTRKLLEESRSLTEKLQKNENELRKNAAQMERTQIELEKSNIELAAKISEVETGQKRLHALLENASEVITIYNSEGIVQYVSPSVKNILGFIPDEMIGTNRFERGDKILQETFDELILNPKIEKIFEYQYTNKNKQRVWLETRARNLTDNTAINGIIFNTRDITVKKEAETAKRLSSEMQALSENSLDMIVRVDQAGNFFYANPMTKTFIGKTSEELIHNNINTVDLNTYVVNFLKEIIVKTNSAKEEIQTETEFTINDNKRIVQFNSIPEFDQNGLIATFLFVVHDITERKEIEIEIENKNKNITESINYAQRIQSAIIPDFKIIKRYLPKSFIFYEPRDIVSGDLPWFFIKNDEIYIAAIDCTGHGVPGTLLSFIGYFSLNNIVGKAEKQTTGEILDELHYQVRKTLKQDSPDSKARDGMDIALIKINLTEQILEFSGAHRPLFHLRGNDLNRLRGDRKAVGGKPMGRKEDEINFETFKIELDKTDKIFIFTDGFPDQIGGEDGRKYQAGRIQEEIIEKNNFSMNEYYNYFVNQFKDWKKGYKQIDDILFIGIEI